MQVGRAEPPATIINFSLGCGTQPLPGLKLLMVLGTRPPGSERGAGRAPDSRRELQSAPPSPAALLSAPPPQPRFPKPEIAGIPQQGSCRGLDHRAAGAPGSHWAASQHRRSLQRSGGTCAGCTPGSAASAFLRTLGRHARAEICRVFGGAMPRTLCPRGGSVRRNGDTEVQASAEPQ